MREWQSLPCWIRLTDHGNTDQVKLNNFNQQKPQRCIFRLSLNVIHLFKSSNDMHFLQPKFWYHYEISKVKSKIWFKVGDDVLAANNGNSKRNSQKVHFQLISWCKDLWCWLLCYFDCAIDHILDRSIGGDTKTKITR